MPNNDDTYQIMGLGGGLFLLLILVIIFGSVTLAGQSKIRSSISDVQAEQKKIVYELEANATQHAQQTADRKAMLDNIWAAVVEAKAGIVAENDRAINNLVQEEASRLRHWVQGGDTAPAQQDYATLALSQLSQMLRAEDAAASADGIEQHNLMSAADEAKRLDSVYAALTVAPAFSTFYKQQVAYLAAVLVEKGNATALNPFEAFGFFCQHHGIDKTKIRWDRLAQRFSLADHPEE